VQRIWLLAVSMLSVQVGAGVAVRLMDDVGAPAVVMFRQGGAAVVLLAVCRPGLRGRSRRDLATIGAFGVALATMNTSFYAAIERLPLGVAVTIELLGPLALAASLSRRLAHLGCVAVAAVGMMLLGMSSGDTDPVGLLLALVAACAWAAYILLSRATGRQSSGMGSLGLAMALAAILVTPAGVAPGASLLRPHVLALAAVVAVLAGLVPYSLELLALRHVPPRVFGVLMCMSPVAAAGSGFVLLAQRPSVPDAFGMVLIIAASVATVGFGDERDEKSSGALAVAVGPGTANEITTLCPR
jgi:inner membrane transporter RhtA